tara:strand:- start:739 stop:984 length:246 start_codon:yes stop_codon:yes gene_type:complete
LVEGLKNNLVKVVFTKVNGDERTMMCTLHHSVLPEPILTEEDRKINPDTISVWDINNGGWRSFRLDSIKEFKVVESFQEMI